MTAGTITPAAATAPWGSFAYHKHTVRELTKSVEEISGETADALAGLSRSLDSLANVAFNNRLTLDYRLADQRGVCMVINKTCCAYSNNSGQGEANIKKTYEQAEWLHNTTVKG